MRISYREALKLGLREALTKNPNTFLIGEDVGAYGGSYAVSKGLLKEFGPHRVRDTPLSEAGFVGAGIGAALGGLHPIVEIMTINFSLLALDQIINSAAFMHHMSGGQLAVPLILRMTTGAGRQLGAQHSNSFEGWFAHIPGLIIFAPSSIEDARYSLEFALREQNPVLMVEHAQLLNDEDELPEKNTSYSLFSSNIRKTGDQITVVSFGANVKKCLAVADKLEKQNLSLEVIDLRILRPLQLELVFESVKKTHRLLLVDEGWLTGNLSAEIGIRVAEKFFDSLKCPILRIGKKEVPVPYSKHLEDLTLPQEEGIELAAREMLK
ncbi:MAG: hypothetical protein RJB66_788 [Pseudomonadota bacterium]|jgi:pyruvate dehydrogenase E1 component beta subunit